MLISLKDYKNNGKVFGQYYENDQIFVFFGNRHFEKEHLSFFPDIKFQFLKQVHGNSVIQFDRYTEELQSADGLFTSSPKLAMVIQTADCLPIMIYDQSKKWVMGIHAGWRGVENKIIKLGIEKLLEVSSKTDFSVFIGPHIQYKSFEVQKDVADKLKSCVGSEVESVHDDYTNKYFINLKKIVHAQIQELPVKIQDLYMSNIDTMTNEDHSSFRRQKGPCRNYSFIYLK